MNIHHLELFYYVAKHGGVSAAARRIPYGIQQPAISAQVISLESTLGTALFTRRPFALTRAGEELFAFISPFFGGLQEMEGKLRGGSEVQLRIGAPETIQRAYLPQLLKAARVRFPQLRFTLIPAQVEEIEARLCARELDVGISPLLGPRREGIRHKEVLQVRLALIVPARSRLKTAEALWQQDRIAEPLVTVSAENPVCRLFQAELQKRGVEWFPSIELKSQDLIAQYVAEGFGIGLVLEEVGRPPAKGTRTLPLAAFPAVPYGLLWCEPLSPLLELFMAEAEALAQRVMAQ